METDVLSYFIGEIFSQITFNQRFSNYIISNNLNSDPKFFKVEISQWNLVVFFLER